MKTETFEAKGTEEIKNMSAIQLLNEAEEMLAENIQWFTDKFDLQIRQGDKEVINRLAMLNESWRNIVFSVPKI